MFENQDHGGSWQKEENNLKYCLGMDEKTRLITVDRYRAEI